MVGAVNPYLSFNGNCEEAFCFYRSVFGGEFDCIGRYKDIPDEEIPEAEREKIMHISLPLTEHVALMGADVCGDLGQKVKFGDHVILSICTLTEQETRRIYEALSKDGIIIAPLEKTFWADLYAQFADRFGIVWALNYMKDAVEK